MDSRMDCCHWQAQLEHNQPFPWIAGKVCPLKTRGALSPPWHSITPSILVCSVELQLLSGLESFWLFLFLGQKMESLCWVSDITVRGFTYFSAMKMHLFYTVVTGSAKTLNNILLLASEWQLSLRSACFVYIFGWLTFIEHCYMLSTRVYIGELIHEVKRYLLSAFFVLGLF